MISILNEKDCCGCGACASICPKSAIFMSSSGTLGARLPVISNEICVDCGLCERACPMLNKEDVTAKAFEQRAYASYSKNDELRFASSSGGMFLTLAKHCIDDGYRVYGASFNEGMKLKCTLATSYEELAPLAKSKYLQSELDGEYRKIEESLKNGEKVLFVSTPCQVSALKLFLKKEYGNLLTVDFFCHGVPSQSFFDECLAFEDEKKSRRTLEYTFREKVKNGVTPHYFKIKYEKNGKEQVKTDFYYKSLFYALFQQYITLRESCYDCMFATKERCSDITIGDFHDIDSYVKGINRFDGVSTVIVNTEKGQELLESVKDTLELFDMDMDRLISDKVIFAGGTKRPKGRDGFVELYNEHGLKGISKRYFGFKRYYKQSIYYRLPKPFRKVMKKLL